MQNPAKPDATTIKTFRADRGLVLRLELLARLEGTSASEVIRRAIDERARSIVAAVPAPNDARR